MATNIAQLTRKAQLHKQKGRPLQALELLDHALPLAAAALADLHGQRGGALRAAALWDAAIAEYDTGHALEVAYALASTYNGLNRLVCRLARPASATRGPRPPALDMAAELTALQGRLAQRVQGGATSVWDLGDLALVAALRADRRTVRKTAAAWLALQPAHKARGAYLGTLDQLITAGCPGLATVRLLQRTLAE